MKLILYLVPLLLLSDICLAQAIGVSPSTLSFNVVPGGSAKKMFTIFNPSDEEVSYEISVPDLNWFKFSSSKGKILSRDKVDIIAEVKVPQNAGKSQAAINIVFSTDNANNGIGLMPSAQIKATISTAKINALPMLTAGVVAYESKSAKLTRDTALFIVVMALLSCLGIFQLLKNRKRYKSKTNPRLHGRRVLPRGKGRKRDFERHWKAVPEGIFHHYERR